MTFGPLVKHFTYDGLGRLIRTQSPLPDPQTAAALNIPLPLRSERHYYDGVRRLATLVVDPLIPVAALPGGEPELDPEGLSLGQEMQQAGDPVGEGDPIEPNPIPTPVPSVLAREYVWGPGDGPADVDELLAQFDEQHQPIWILQDASGDVVAAADLGAPAVRPPGVPETVPADAFTARLVWLGSHEAYGGIVAARTLHPHAPIHAGHKGLFVERLDAGVIDGLPGLPGTGGGTSRVETPRLSPGAALLAHARNRWLHAGLGTWTSNDPNASGQIVVDIAVYHGRSSSDPTATYSLDASYADGPNLSAAYRAAPMSGGDPLGLFFMPGPSDYVQDMAESLINDYAAHLEWDVEWATDWSLDDEAHSRKSSRWVYEALGWGLYNSFDIGGFNPLSNLSDWVGGRRGKNSDPRSPNVPKFKQKYAPGNGPYKNLSIQGHIPRIGGRFDDQQWSMIIAENMKRNNGRLRSDVTGRFLARSSGTPASAQVDHIRPRARGGDNSFGNAQVVEAFYNQSKGIK